MSHFHLTRRRLLAGVGTSAVGSLLPCPALTRGIQVPHFKGVQFHDGSSEMGQKMAMGFNSATIRTPKLRAVCETTDGVTNAVNWARETKRRFSIFSTGHCFSDHSQHDDLVIDTSQLNGIKWDEESGLLACGAGTFIGNVYNELAPKRLGLAGGTYGSVGVAGMTLGGGIGFLGRSHGLLCDQLDSVTMVTSDGSQVTASATENPDLFWACRGGGGGNFGIVTQLRYRPALIPTRTKIAPFFPFSLKDTARLVHNWQHWTQAQGKDLTSHLLLYKRRQNEFVVGLQGDAVLDTRQTRSRLQDLFGRQQPIHENYISDAYSEKVRSRRKAWDNNVSPTDFVSRTDYVNSSLSLADIKALLETLNDYAPGLIKLTFEALGGAIADKSNEATAYPHRDAHYLVEYRAGFRSPVERQHLSGGLDRARQIFSPYISGGIYVNYPYRGLDNWQRAYWQDNLERLVEIKAKWDPDNLFRHSQSIPTSMADIS